MSLTKAADLLIGKLEKGEDDLIPFLPNTVDLVYGGIDYAISVLGVKKITRSTIINYFEDARANWKSVPIPKNYSRYSVTSWCKEKDIKPLHYYAPMSERTVWFKEDADLFAFTLKFGVS
jgi:spore maturation protein CgeB